MRNTLAAVLVVLAVSITNAAAAQRAQRDSDAASFPSKPIRVLVPQAPGGSNDIMARFIAAGLSERLGRQVIVDNRAGAEGVIATEIVARANPDGYTLLQASTAFTMNPAVMKLPYDPVKDFDWVAMFGRGPVVVLIGPALPVSTLQELQAVSRQKKNFITIAAPGGFGHFVNAMFKSHAKLDAEIALYKGGAPALIDVVSGQAHLGAATLPTATPVMRGGKVKALLVTGPKRLAAYPDVPTAAEAGLPSYDAAIWWGWAATAHTPQPVLDKMSEHVKAILETPEAAKRFAADGADIEYKSSTEMRKLVPADIAKWEKVARDAGMSKR